jgi:hypothetical protein
MVHIAITHSDIFWIQRIHRNRAAKTLLQDTNALLGW